jgi:very-short-patch-repair endonuclease
LAVYLDGQPHEGREDRDERLRELLAQRHGVKVLSIKTKGKNVTEVVEEILKVAKQ